MKRVAIVGGEIHLVVDRLREVRELWVDGGRTRSTFKDGALVWTADATDGAQFVIA